MKNLFILLTACVAVSAMAQNPEALKKRLAKNDLSTEDPKKSGQIATWYERTNIFLDMANAYTSKLMQGIPMEQITMIIGKPISSENVVLIETPYAKHTYEDFDLYSSPDGSSTQFWSTKKEVMPDAIYKALEALNKAKTISDKDFVGNGKGRDLAIKLQGQFIINARSMYSLSDPSGAAKAFDAAVKSAQLIGTIDTMTIYFAGAAAAEAKDYDLVVDNMNKLISLGREMDGSVYSFLAMGQDGKGDSKTAIETLEKGFSKYPKNPQILSELINIYIKTGSEPTKLIQIIKTAEELDPKNASMYAVEGNVWEKLGNKAEAQKAYMKSLAIEPQFNAYYNLGVLYALEGDDLGKKANDLDLNDEKGYKALMDQRMEVYIKAIDVLEKAHALEPTEPNTMQLLRDLYFQRRDISDDMMKRYQYFNDLYNKAKN